MCAFYSFFRAIKVQGLFFSSSLYIYIYSAESFNFVGKIKKLLKFNENLVGFKNIWQSQHCFIKVKYQVCVFS